jgi:DnaK suppressor protein
MNATDRKKVEARLLEERRGAMDTLGTLDERTRELLGTGDDGELSNYPQHLADEGTDTMEQEKSYLLASAEGRRLYQIDEALRRLYKEPDDFGKCAVCGREIAAERLDLLPWTTMCAEHAEQDETSQAAS